MMQVTLNDSRLNIFVLTVIKKWLHIKFMSALKFCLMIPWVTFQVSGKRNIIQTRKIWSSPSICFTVFEPLEICIEKLGNFVSTKLKELKVVLWFKFFLPACPDFYFIVKAPRRSLVLRACSYYKSDSKFY